MKNFSVFFCLPSEYIHVTLPQCELITKGLDKKNLIISDIKNLIIVNIHYNIIKNQKIVLTIS